ncbi:hypothetical protein ACH4ZX_37780 [Streptomyces sp. NPDC020490]|uniref:hypothetical protein n=1 Tax=Streptomyces sp. NPDC020490 TaxID=3365078 RepID=UPI003790F575
MTENPERPRVPYERTYVQNVGPDGWGVQSTNATINVYGSRLPAIEELPAPAELDPAWLMEQPSRLLDARSRIVPFVGREAELERLRQWRDANGPRLSVLLLHAPGGQGKTRLALEFAERSRGRTGPGPSAARPWHVLHAGFQGAPPGPFPSGNDVAPPGDAAGVLLVVDYADRWAHSELERLLTSPVLHQQTPTRVLLVGRTVRWFAALRAELGDRRAAADDLRLPSLAEDRLRMFTAARDRYADSALYGVADPVSIQPPASLGRRDFGLPLNLQMAALVAVDARKNGTAPSLSEPHQLSAYLLDRERLAWQRLVDAGRHGQDYRTGQSVMAKTVFTAVLTGAVGHGTGKRALRRLALPEPHDHLLDDHRFCYPPADRATVLEPLYPDRLAEDFLGLLTPGHDISSYEPDPWANDAPATLTATPAGPTPGVTAEEDLRAVIAPRAVTFLASAAARWAHLGKEILYPLLCRDPGLAIAAGSSALTALAALGDPGGPDETGDGALDPDLLAVLEAVETLLPEGSDVDLDIGILAVMEGRARPAGRPATARPRARRSSTSASPSGACNGSRRPPPYGSGPWASSEGPATAAVREWRGPAWAPLWRSRTVPAMPSQPASRPSRRSATPASRARKRCSRASSAPVSPQRAGMPSPPPPTCVRPSSTNVWGTAPRRARPCAMSASPWRTRGSTRRRSPGTRGPRRSSTRHVTTRTRPTSCAGWPEP